MSRKDLIKMFGSENAETFNKCSKAYEKGRADAIDGFVDELIKPSNYERFDFDDCLDSSDKTNDFFKYVFAMAEKVKNK